MLSPGVSQTGLCVSVPGSYSKTRTFENLGKIKLDMLLYHGTFQGLYYAIS